MKQWIRWGVAWVLQQPALVNLSSAKSGLRAAMHVLEKIPSHVGKHGAGAELTRRWNWWELPDGRVRIARWTKWWRSIRGTVGTAGRTTRTAGVAWRATAVTTKGWSTGGTAMGACAVGAGRCATRCVRGRTTSRSASAAGRRSAITTSRRAAVGAARGAPPDGPPGGP
jgi:hypothetical protein